MVLRAIEDKIRISMAIKMTMWGPGGVTAPGMEIMDRIWMEMTCFLRDIEIRNLVIEGKNRKIFSGCLGVLEQIDRVVTEIKLMPRVEWIITSRRVDRMTSGIILIWIVMV